MVDINLNLPGEKLAIKIVEALSKGVGTITKPWQIEREAIAIANSDRIKRLAEEQVRSEIEQLRSGQKVLDAKYRLTSTPQSISSSEIELIQQLADSYLATLRQQGVSPTTLLALEHQINLEQISRLAIEEAIDDADPNIDEKPIEPDWFAQWRKRAQDVSDEDMQRLWARALSGQAKKGGAFSVHTLDFLSRMSRQDAEKISLLGQFALDGDFIFRTQTGLLPTISTAGLTFEDLLMFEVLGVLIGVSSGLGLGKNKNTWKHNGANVATIRLAKEVLFIFPNDPNKDQIRFDCYPITFIGKELLKLASFNPSHAHLLEVANAMRKEGAPKIGNILHESADGGVSISELTDI